MKSFRFAAFILMTTSLALAAGPTGPAKQLIDHYKMEKIPVEGAWFHVTYGSTEKTAAEALPQVAQAAAAGLAGQLRLAFVSNIAYGPLPEWLRSFRDAHPDVQLQLREATLDVQLAAFDADEIDAGFVLHAAVHEAHPDIVAMCHAHTVYGVAWASLGRPLPDRANWVLSRDAAFKPAGATVFATLDQALNAGQGRELAVIGGAELYRQTLPLATRVNEVVGIEGEAGTFQHA